ncbi:MULTISPECIES: TetR/AcrR family transcriptional regulator [unclassified Pseudoalteromonas]|uniref:TetR/AcrR family transcriptional regulator n=1 Tax=unclassified Pseudoalteromonas TaxID=194690 RepID=UPI0025B2E66F|nr:MULTISPECIES: TetR/AcrR family transcriptional regulator [unclassified Pseudoalteromonas]MDN3377931.1 TetR/AcrR family transcriptional regulator [Pseudoalteromonas sp. APC 3893]MDN3386126.1 TetR/AcrR family transcriptional regulator [Pseudoalteromonas sp. APC 4017]
MSKKEITRNKILAAAWELFIELGYESTSTRSIANNAGVAAGTVFSHFENKIDLLKAGMLLQIDNIITTAALTDKQHSPRLKLRHYALPLFTFYCENKEFSKVLISDIIWQADFFNFQLNEFKKMLFSEQPQYDEVKATVMMDCYFMTLLSGLNETHPKPETMLRMLTNKLALL